jgi:hypothetical protein
LDGKNRVNGLKMGRMHWLIGEYWWHNIFYVDNRATKCAKEAKQVNGTRFNRAIVTAGLKKPGSCRQKKSCLKVGRISIL